MGNAESTHGSGVGMMIAGFLLAPFTAGASTALIAGGAATGIVGTSAHLIAGNTADKQGKDGGKEWVNGFISGAGSGISKLV